MDTHANNLLPPTSEDRYPTDTDLTPDTVSSVTPDTDTVDVELQRNLKRDVALAYTKEYTRQINTLKKEAAALAAADTGGKELIKRSGTENEPAAVQHASSPDQLLRPRAELIPYDESGVWYIDHGDYLLFPGGGVDDGEQPLVAAVRETMEESDIHPLNVQQRSTVEALWPKDSGNDFWDDSPFAGERTYFFIGLHGGTTEFTHADREDFRHYTFAEARNRLRQLINDASQSWAAANNRARLDLVNEAARLARNKRNLQPVKLADAAKLKPLDEYLLFTPEGRMIVRKRKNRRLGLPTTGVGDDVPYAQPIRLTPEEGVPEADYHGYNISLKQGDIGYIPEGYEARDVSDVLAELYGSMGLKENRSYRDLDRARARAILQAVRRRRQGARV